jgi:hypothetical protein
MRKYSHKIMIDGPVIMQEGAPMTPEQVVDRLNNYHDALRIVTEELEAWNLTEGDEEAEQAIHIGKRCLSHNASHEPASKGGKDS